MLDLKLIRLAAPLCLAIGLGACASDQEWANPQTGLKTSQADIAQCENAARNEAWRSATYDSFTNTRYTGMADPRTANEPLHRAIQNPNVKEIRARDLCMEAKGYQSVAVVNGEPQWSPDQLLLAKQNQGPQLVGVTDEQPSAQ